MKNTILKTAILVLQFLLICQVAKAQDFITTWEVRNASTISFDAVTTGTVSYTWQTIPPTAPASGSGTFVGTNVTLTGFPIGTFQNPTVVQLSIQPNNFESCRLDPSGSSFGQELVSVNQWGTNVWGSMEAMFAGISG